MSAGAARPRGSIQRNSLLSPTMAPPPYAYGEIQVDGDGILLAF
jgi:hypothetical protein